MAGRTLLVLTKEPVPGRVKTRLARTVGDAAAASLAWALLTDVLVGASAAAARCRARLEVWHAPDLPSGSLFGLVARAAPAARLRPQGVGDLGERLARAFAGASGARVAVGSDAPALPAGALEAAFDGLYEPRAATLGPTADGGYYAIGLGAALAPELLRGPIRWSTPHAREDTAAALEAAGAAPVALLPPAVDVDDLASLRALAGALGEAPPGVAAATRRWLERHPVA